MSLEEYSADIVRVPLLTCDEEIILGGYIQKMIKILRDNGLDEQISQKNLLDSTKNLSPEAKLVIKRGLRARSRMISANMRLVVAVAKKIKTTQTHLTIQDLIQEGAIGLTRASEKFEPGRGYKFSTYAYWWIRQGIVRATESQEKAIRMPSNMQKTARQIRETRDKLALALKKEPTVAEIAIDIEEDVEKVKRILLADSVVVSLDSNVSPNGDQISLLELIPASASDEDDDDSPEKINLVLTVISALPEEEQELVKQKYGIGCQPVSAKEIAETSGISKHAVRQKQQSIIKKIQYIVDTFFSSQIF